MWVLIAGVRWLNNVVDDILREHLFQVLFFPPKAVAIMEKKQHQKNWKVRFFVAAIGRILSGAWLRFDILGVTVL